MPSQTLPNGYRESSPYHLTEGGDKVGDVNANDTTEVQQRISVLEAEKQELKAEVLKLKESSASQQLSGALGQEELLYNNKRLEAELSSLQSALASLREEKIALEGKVLVLEEEKAAMPSDKVAVLNSAKLMEEVKFDEEGFVDGQDLTKEEFLQAQNEQLKVQCGLLTAELTKLRSTFDAILKAGDNLQADYDQLQAEKDKLHDQLEIVVREKEEVVKENEFLLSDGNALHEDLKKLVHELEKMQDKYRKVAAEKEALQNQATAVTIAGKVGEVARLLEERDKLQLRLTEAEDTAGRLTHDHAILLEEVQSLQEGNATLLRERDALQVEIDDIEALVTQHEALTQDYAQLEMDFNDLLKEKERLEHDLLDRRDSSSLSGGGLSALTEERDVLMAERDQLELTIQELSLENATLEEQLDAARRVTAITQDDGDGRTVHLQQRIEELTKDNAELEEVLANMQEEVAALEARLGDENGHHDDDKEALRAGINQLELTVSQLSQENAQLEEELLGVREQLDHAQDALEHHADAEGMANSAGNPTLHTVVTERQQLADKVAELEAKLDAVHAKTESGRHSGGRGDISEDSARLAETVARLHAENERLETELELVRTHLAQLSHTHTHTDTDKGAGVVADTSRTVLNSLNGHKAEDGGAERVAGTQENEVLILRAEIKQLAQRLGELEQIHQGTVNTYRTHLLSAVQGHMDPDVKEALHSIIEMRSMEQFC